MATCVAMCNMFLGVCNFNFRKIKAENLHLNAETLITT